MILGVLNIFLLSPEFETAVENIHNATTPIAILVCFTGLSLLAMQAHRERSLGDIWPGLLRIFIVSVFLVHLPAIGNWVNDVVVAIEQASGVGNDTAFVDYTAAIKQKWGIDVSVLNSLVPAGPNGATQAAAPSAPTVSHYGYSGDPNIDGNSAQGIGAFPFSSAPHSLVPGQSLALSPSLAAGLTPGQSVTVQLANGQTITGTYADKTATSFNGVTLNRVDIYDPNNEYGSLSGVGVTGIQGGALPQNGNPVGNFFNGLIHPAEAAQATFFGMAVLLLSYVSVGIMWLMMLLQSILLYAEIALAPLFVPFLMVRGFEGIAKGFILSFVGISLWSIGFLVAGLVTKLIIGLALNTGNNTALGAANVAGGGFCWFVVLSIWVMFSSIAGPWMISKRVTAGASGLADMLVGAHAAAGRAYQVGAGAVAGGGGMPVLSQGGVRLAPNYARRPIGVNNGS